LGRDAKPDRLFFSDCDISAPRALILVGVFDRKRIERIGIVVVCPLFERGMIRMC
jgi:hypothetical protein